MKGHNLKRAWPKSDLIPHLGAVPCLRQRRLDADAQHEAFVE